MLLDGPISYTGIQWIDLIEIFNVSRDLSAVYFIVLILVSVELPLCMVVIVVTLSQSFLEPS